MATLTIALDVMGGDNGPHVTLAAALTAHFNYPKLHLILCGQSDLISAYLEQHDCINDPRLSIHDAPEVVEMHERPLYALRNKPNSSMRAAINLVHSGEAQACVSAGNTGALMTIAFYVLKTLPGIDRPALISRLPSVNKNRVFLLDLGANVNCDSEILYQYALMGSVMAEEVEGLTQPRVALLNVGEEQIKGNDQVKQTAQLLSECDDINYIGFVEGNDIFTDKADVVVTDGFVGNVALKACEGLGKLIIEEVKRLSNKNIMYRILAKIALPLLKSLYKSVNPDQYNGASLIGLNGIVVKSHGNASAEAFSYAIDEAIDEVSRQVPQKIGHRVEGVLSLRQ